MNSLAVIFATLGAAMAVGGAIWALASQLASKANRSELEIIRADCKRDMDRVWERIRGLEDKIARNSGAVEALVYDTSRRHTKEVP